MLRHPGDEPVVISRISRRTSGNRSRWACSNLGSTVKASEAAKPSRSRPVRPLTEALGGVAEVRLIGQDEEGVQLSHRQFRAIHTLLPDRADFEPCWPVLRECFGAVRPAATMLVCGLADPRMKIEIEVYARRVAQRV
ncbi:hypothetical protein ABGB18_41260 [Nonomuraea sp. B12E4]|uniref:hypothetical protein n=1 Tax=Nonomuraea sp. B12E4 TaxID=3153564 RepID=UPI00325C38F9